MGRDALGAYNDLVREVRGLLQSVGSRIDQAVDTIMAPASVVQAGLARRDRAESGAHARVGASLLL